LGNEWRFFVFKWSGLLLSFHINPKFEIYIFEICHQQKRFIEAYAHLGVILHHSNHLYFILIWAHRLQFHKIRQFVELGLFLWFTTILIQIEYGVLLVLISIYRFSCFNPIPQVSLLTKLNFVFIYFKINEGCIYGRLLWVTLLHLIRLL